MEWLDIMNKSCHCRSLSDTTVHKRNKRVSISSLIEVKTNASFSKEYKAPAYCLSKFYNNASLTKIGLSKKFKEITYKRPYCLNNVLDSTEPSEERNKILSSIEICLKSSENLITEEKLKVALEVLSQVSNFNSQLCEIMIGIKKIIEEYEKFYQLRVSEVKNLRVEMGEDKQALKILKKRFQKLAHENLNINERIVEIEDKYHEEKGKRLDLKKELRENELIIKELEDNKEKLIYEVELYKKIYKKLRKVQNIEEIHEFIDNFEHIDNEFDKILNISSMHRLSDSFSRDTNRKPSSSSYFNN